MSSVTRITGMATGMDTDTTVKGLMKPYQQRLDKMNQDKQLVQWKQDLYRSIMSDINSFKSSFLDVTKPENYMLSKNAYSSYDVKAYDTGTSNISTGVSVSATTGAIAGSYKVDFTGGNIATAAGVQSYTANGIGIQNITVPGNAKADTKLVDIGVIGATSIDITYNGGATKSIAINTNMTLSDLASAINSGTSSGVVARFSELTGKFTIQTANTGATTKISLDTTAAGGNLLEKLNLGTAGTTTVSETTANYKIDPMDLSVKITPPGGTGVQVTNASNNFTADGITYNFSAGAKSADIAVTADTQKTYDRIKGFIDKYNELIGKIGDKIEEKKQYTYLPLTDEQKTSMKAEEITAWEEKAKVGLLKGDSILSNMLTSMRSVFSQAVKDAGINLSEVGLSTSSDVTQRGKIIIDETKLKAAIQTRGDQVANIFSKMSTSQSSYSPDLSVTDRATRFSEEGIFQRLNDILADNIRTTRNSYGKKGLLLEKAGIKGDFSEYSNLLTKDLLDKQTAIDAMVTRMTAKENQYYSQFAKLETAMNKMNSQSSWLAQQLGTSK